MLTRERFLDLYTLKYGTMREQLAADVDDLIEFERERLANVIGAVSALAKTNPHGVVGWETEAGAELGFALLGCRFCDSEAVTGRESPDDDHNDGCVWIIARRALVAVQ